jgi:hypothetical protein
MNRRKMGLSGSPTGLSVCGAAQSYQQIVNHNVRAADLK